MKLNVIEVLLFNFKPVGDHVSVTVDRYGIWAKYIIFNCQSLRIYWIRDNHGPPKWKWASPEFMIFRMKLTELTIEISFQYFPTLPKRKSIHFVPRRNDTANVLAIKVCQCQIYLWFKNKLKLHMFNLPMKRRVDSVKPL